MPSSSHLKRADSVINIHLRAAWNRAEVEKLDQQSSVRIEQNMLDLILTCDPTPTGRYACWLARWRRRMWPIMGLRGMSSIEELETLTSALKRFDSIRSQLLPTHRDINLYANIEELLAVKTGQRSQHVREAQASERARALAGSATLFCEAKWRLVRLDTAEAAIWWGRGTRWCTSSRNGEAFAAYHAKGQLLVLLTPTGRYQLATDSEEFRDAADRPARLTGVLARAPAPLRQMLLPSSERDSIP
ncbi:hypothetical protein ASD83_10850 [Devosia sp. Root685]|uniref:hypothetical protein n=1 Tax=Devosia sp. Root685 TaxID=1736587 RepID=UPI0006F481B8|nr:hypothetical protein [Devosia sp. Root685]KRA97609.1 hypothetical protein ASD83_10850 [Devosia sp. Root685]